MQIGLPPRGYGPAARPFWSAPTNPANKGTLDDCVQRFAEYLASLDRLSRWATYRRRRLLGCFAFVRGLLVDSARLKRSRVSSISEPPGVTFELSCGIRDLMGKLGPPRRRGSPPQAAPRRCVQRHRALAGNTPVLERAAARALAPELTFARLFEPSRSSAVSRSSLGSRPMRIVVATVALASCLTACAVGFTSAPDEAPGDASVPTVDAAARSASPRWCGSLVRHEFLRAPRPRDRVDLFRFAARETPAGPESGRAPS